MERKIAIHEDGILVFNPEIQDNPKDYPPSGLDNLFKAEESHFWFKVRKNKIKEMLNKYLLEESKILDLGGGTGNVAKFLQEQGFEVSLGDLHLNGLKYAKEKGIKKLYQFDLFNTPLKEEFDAICMFDVLEHFDDDLLALNKAKSMLKKNGKIIITVPAHNWLWNRDDKIAAHKRRYSKERLKKIIKSSGFEINHISYFFMLLTPVLLLRRWLNPDSSKEVSNEEYTKGIKINLINNKILLGLCTLEEKLIPWYFRPFGGSLIIVAEKIN